MQSGLVIGIGSVGETLIHQFASEKVNGLRYVRGSAVASVNAAVSGSVNGLVFIILDGRDADAVLRASDIASSLRGMNALVLVLLSAPANCSTQLDVSYPTLSVLVDGLLVVPRDDFAHAVTVVVNGLSASLGELGFVSVDINDVRTALMGDRPAQLTIGYGSGPERALRAVMQAMSNPGLSPQNLTTSTGIFVIVAGPRSMHLEELASALNIIRGMAGENTHVYPGAYHDARLGNLLRLTIIRS